MTDDTKRRYLMGPFEGNDLRCLMTLETAIEELREFFASEDPGEVVKFKIVEMTDAEVDALPEL